VSPEDLHITLRADPRLLKAVRGLVQGYVRSCGISAERCDEVVLAVCEACTNAMRHSYNGRRDERLDLAFRCEGGEVVIELHDEGEPIPRACTRPRETAVKDLASLEPGGLGVSLMWRVFDEVEYCPGERRGNCVTMRLKCPEGE